MSAQSSQKELLQRHSQTIYALVYDQVKAKGPESLPELVPMATYMTLAPFLGAEEAFALANGDS